MADLRVELLAVEDCPHLEQARRDLETVLRKGIIEIADPADLRERPGRRRVPRLPGLAHDPDQRRRRRSRSRICRSRLAAGSTATTTVECSARRRSRRFGPPSTPTAAAGSKRSSARRRARVAGFAREADAAEASAESEEHQPGGLTDGLRRDRPGPAASDSCGRCFISLSHRRSLARLAVRSPLTRPVVARFVAGETLEAALPAIAALQERRPPDHGRRPGRIGHVARAGHRRGRSLRGDRSPPSSARGLDANVSLKLTQMGLEIGRDLCRANVMRIVEAARAVDGFVRFDMEDHTRTDATLEIWRAAHEALSGRRRRDPVGAAAQRRRRGARSSPLGGRVRLCKGAYDEPGSVAYRSKAAVDANYARLMERLLSGGRPPGPCHPRPEARSPEPSRSPSGRGSAATGSSSRCSTASAATCSGCSSTAATRSASTSRTAREWYPYFMRRLAERPANVGFMLRAVVHEERRRVRGR